MLSTAVTVPQVQFTTQSVAGAGQATAASVGLAPATTPVTPYGGNSATGILTAPGGFGTTYVPTGTSSSGLALQTVNAAGRVGSGSVLGFIAGGAMAMLAL
jgi:hypothetical protein